MRYRAGAPADILLRRVDTKEAPFRCPHCGRRFRRSDVCSRHATKFCSRNSHDHAGRAAGDVSSSRVKVACDACRAKKLKCTGTLPCSACAKGSRQCHYTDDVFSGQRPADDTQVGCQ